MLKNVTRFQSSKYDYYFHLTSPVLIFVKSFPIDESAVRQKEDVAYLFPFQYFSKSQLPSKVTFAFKHRRKNLTILDTFFSDVGSGSSA